MIKLSTLWEATAVLQLVQALGETPTISTEGDASELLSLPDVLPVQALASWNLDIDKAYRDVDVTVLPYVELLKSQWPIVNQILPPRLPGQVSMGGGIVVSPFGPKKELDIPWAAWRAIVRLLRTYHVPVWLLGARGQWMDQVAFTESEILSELPLAKKVEVVAAADLMVGVPNEWSWIAAGFTKSMVLLYPEQVPNKRWFHYSHDKFGRIIYSSSAIDIPRMLAGLAKLVTIVT